MKTTEEKIEQKEKTLKDVNLTLEMSMHLYSITTSEYGQLYEENKAKDVDSKHIAGIASLLSKITELLRTRNDIENEINGMLELDEQSQPSTTEIKGSKAEILRLLDDARKVK